MSNAPITVEGRDLPEAVIKNIVRGPIVKPIVESSLLSNDIVSGSLGFNQSVYKVKLIANGRTFNMLLPPSIESKHPGRSNPLQLPGLQIESMSNISKLKIPGFFPIYQHLGVESLYVSMSGMFTGYDGETQYSSAGDWEGWANPEIKQGQDAYTAACDLFDFAVKNKALTTVTISTSDGSFEPKKSASDNFRDERANIRFKGYIKELKQIYIRQDRVYYMLKFEIIDLGNSKKECAPSKVNNTLLNNITSAASGIGLKDKGPTAKAFSQLFNDLIQFNAIYPNNVGRTFSQLFNELIDFKAVYPTNNTGKAFSQAFNDLIEFNAIYPSSTGRTFSQLFNDKLEFEAKYPNKTGRAFSQAFNDLIEFNAIYPNEVGRSFSQAFNSLIEFNAKYPDGNGRVFNQAFNDLIEFNEVYPNKPTTSIPNTNSDLTPNSNPNPLENQIKSIYQQESRSELYQVFIKNPETTLGKVKNYLDLFVFDDSVKITYLGNSKISALSVSQPLTQDYGLFKVENSVYYAVPIEGESPKKYTLRLLTDYSSFTPTGN